MIEHPQIAALQARAQRRRSLAWLGLAEPLLGIPSVPLTPRHVLELSFADNPYFAGGLPTQAATYDILWRLHPHHQRPDQRLRGIPTWHRLQIYLRLRRRWRRDPVAVIRAIRARLEETFADAPGSDAEGEGPSPLTALPHWIDSLQLFFCAQAGHAWHHVIDTPLAQLFQVRRAWAIEHGDTPIDPENAEIARVMRQSLRRQPSARARA